KKARHNYPGDIILDLGNPCGKNTIVKSRNLAPNWKCLSLYHSNIKLLWGSSASQEHQSKTKLLTCGPLGNIPEPNYSMSDKLKIIGALGAAHVRQITALTFRSMIKEETSAVRFHTSTWHSIPSQQSERNEERRSAGSFCGICHCKYDPVLETASLSSKEIAPIIIIIIMTIITIPGLDLQHQCPPPNIQLILDFPEI
ncbi:hypothetical protein STEG23_019321, partial [Scotinomys teguina]